MSKQISGKLGLLTLAILGISYTILSSTALAQSAPSSACGFGNFSDTCTQLSTSSPGPPTTATPSSPILQQSSGPPPPPPPSPSGISISQPGPPPPVQTRIPEPSLLLALGLIGGSIIYSGCKKITNPHN